MARIEDEPWVRAATLVVAAHDSKHLWYGGKVGGGREPIVRADYICDGIADHPKIAERWEKEAKAKNPKKKAK